MHTIAGSTCGSVPLHYVAPHSVGRDSKVAADRHRQYGVQGCGKFSLKNMTDLCKSDYRRHCAEELMDWQIISVNFTNAWWLFCGVAEHVLSSKEKRPGREF